MAEKLCPCGKPARQKYCSEKCMKLYAGRAWRAKNKAKVRAYMQRYHKQWRDRNKDRVRQYAANRTPEQKRRVYLRVREKHLAKAKVYYQKNAEVIKARVRAYHHANKEKVKAKAAAYRAKNRERLAAKQLERYYERQEYMTQWRKLNAEVLKARRQASYWANREEYLRRQRERNRQMDPEKRKARSRMYAAKQNAKVPPEERRARDKKSRHDRLARKLALELSLLAVKLQQTPTPSGGTPPASRPQP